VNATTAAGSQFFPMALVPPIYSYGLPNGTEIVDNRTLRNANCAEMPENADTLRYKITVSYKTKLPHTDSFSEPHK
jgi:hypothetical protein